ncbi:adaptin N terminal region-domain-containing protein [Scheffersomyces xylosifermentans]|uniref:adaptin N terminal region-domain-containing protein n=1 Tax=Scheffersomyces xylosifermentans TaxID=1304137 RepID=UPI00315C7E65
MSDGKYFAKSKSVELRAELEQALKKSKPQPRIKIVLRKVIANIILNNNELANLMPEITNLLTIDDLEIRKLCFHYFTNYAHINPQGATEALPIFARFKDDVSPVVRALTLRTISSISNKDYVDLTVHAVRVGLKDSDPHVRKTAAYAVSRLYQHDPKKTEAQGLIDDLNELLYDKTQVVVSNALASLSYVTEHSKALSLTIDKAHSMALISHLSTTNEWCQIYILNSLMSYVPQTSEEALDLIDATIPSLQHENSSVVLNAIKVIVYYSHYVRNPELVMPTLPNRLGTSLVSLLAKPSEIQFLVLRNVILLLLGNKDLVHFDVEMFFCRYDDPIYVKDTKLEIIYLLANEQNVLVVLKELEEYATEVDVSMARKAIRAFGNLAVKLDNAADECVSVICDLISNGISYIVQESAIVLKNILRKYPGRFNFAVNEITKHYKVIDEPDAKTAMIWILGQYCEKIEKSEQILEDLISNFKDDPIEVQYATLTAATKLYLKIPEKGEKLVLQVLKWATEEVDNPDIRDRGFIYWRLLSSEDASGQNGVFQENTKQIILMPTPLISADNDNIDPKILEELELNIGTLASIYLKPVDHVFRLAKRKQLVNSPALQRKAPRPITSSSARDSTPEVTHSPQVNQNPTYGTFSPSDNLHQKHDSGRSSRNSNLSRKKSFDSSASSNEEGGSRKNSFAKMLSKKASQLAQGRKGSKS